MTQITNNVPVFSTQPQDNVNTPLGIQTSKGEGGQPMLDIPNPEDPGMRGDKSSEGRPSGQWMATGWTNSADNLKGIWVQ